MRHKVSPYRIQSKVIFALFVRELRSRFGKYRLGYFWALIEPMAHIVFISLIFAFGFRASRVAGISPPLLVLTGFVPFQFFIHSVTSSLHAVESNRPLFYFRRVKAADTIAARILLESVVLVCSFSLLLAGFAYFGQPVEFAAPLELFVILGLFVALCAGISFIFSVVGALYPESTKIIPLFIRPLYFVSGIFFAADTLPDPFRTYALYNPLLHVIDLTRRHMFSTFTSESASFAYLTWCSIVVLFVGLALYRVNRRHIVASKNQ